MAAKKKNSLVNNINKRKKAGKSRSKKASTVSKDSYAEMEKGWPHSKKKKAAAKSKKKMAAAKPKKKAAAKPKKRATAKPKKKRAAAKKKKSA